ncbi:hypothetical protein PVK06_040686 [Gossypium arboreum]|uniref:Uncharacterized protein n=1 Tax=Gossypium arboreum TaxID=29729 RepID=A0ABR0N901_GOSAR|nr:hypothetical protein PVK06_040686 [Gossypium arboreum]
MGGVSGGVGPLKPQEDSPNVDGLVGGFNGSAAAFGAANLFLSKAVIDPPSSALNQPMRVMDTPFKKPGQQNKEIGRLSTLSGNIDNIALLSADSSKIISNSSSLTSMTLSYFNLFFVGQEQNEGNDETMQPKSVSMVPEPIEVQVLDSSSGLNPNRHSAVSFKEIRPAYGDSSRKTKVSISGNNKSRNIGKLLGGGIWVGWKDNIYINVIHNHPQFMLFHVQGNNIFISFFIFVVYGSPDRVKRKSLWAGLMEVLPPDPAP